MNEHQPLQRLLALLALSSLLGLGACSDSSGGSSTTDPSRITPGAPLSGLTADELAAFERGKVLFERRFKPSEGLGPLYNATSCASCHSIPTTGGSSQLYRNFYLAMWFDTTSMEQKSLPLIQSPIVPAFGDGGNSRFTLEGDRSFVPAEVNGSPVIMAQRNAISIFGTGLFEFVTNATIIGLSDPEDADADGISGRYNTDGVFVGRLGVKAQSNNIEIFTRAPLKNQMGITSEPFLGSMGVAMLGHGMSRQATTPLDMPTLDSDGVDDPEISRDDLGDLIAFTRFLAPPEPMTPFSEAATRGEMQFELLGCVKCHIPELPTTRFGPARAYTDLLLHEMGPDLADGLGGGFGRPQFSSLSLPGPEMEFRTQPLWGVSFHAPFLHDGRAETLHEAIEMHGGEAESIRNAFLALPPADQDDVIAFLEHL